MLSVTLTPGKVFQPQERVDNAKLNLTGSPSVALEGAATATQIQDASVSVAKTDFDAGNAAAVDLRAGGALPVFDIVTARPVFNPRRYVGATDQLKIQAAIDAAIAEGGGVILFDQDFTLDDLTAGTIEGSIYHYLWAYSASKVQLTFRGIRNARLFNNSSAGSANGVCLLGVKGWMEDLVVEGVTFDNVLNFADHATSGVCLYENAQGLTRARIEGCGFQSLSHPIIGAGRSVRVVQNNFNYPIGDPRSVAALAAGGANSYAVTLLPAYGLVEDVALVGNRMNIDKILLHPWTGIGPYGFANVQAQGVRIDENIIHRAMGEAIRIEARPIGSPNSWRDVPREVSVRGNQIEFEDLSGQSAITARQGINCNDAGASITGNRIRNCYQGIFVNGGPAGYDAGNDLTTRLKKIDIVGNDIELAADLAMVDGSTFGAQARRGISVVYARRVKVAENLVSFAGRTSAGVVAKHWMLPAIQIAMVDDARVGQNEIYGPVDTTSSSADLLWLAGITLESVRKSEIAPNYFRNLNIGVSGAPGVGSPVQSSTVELAEQRMEDVVWPYASLDGSTNDAGTVTPATLHKRVTGNGIRLRKARTSFACDAATLGGGFVGGYVRVGSFLYGINGRVRIWNEGPNPFTHATLETAYWNDATAGHGGLAQVGFVQEGGTAAFSKARVCVNNAPADRVCHLDVYVAGLSSNRIFVEVECPFVGYEGLWGAPNLPANMPAGYVDANATGLVEVVFAPGVAMAGGNLTLENGAWNGTHVVMGANHLWVRASDGVMLYKAGVPANDSDGHAF